MDSHIFRLAGYCLVLMCKKHDQQHCYQILDFPLVIFPKSLSQIFILNSVKSRIYRVYENSLSLHSK